ncbi:MAG TPA: hypothetical protein VJT08_06550 [Terriglobales bacterium]|nr:hypothetical protein [Terriglobales bacterium]
MDVKDGLISTAGLVLFLIVWGFAQWDARRTKAKAGQSTPRGEKAERSAGHVNDVSGLRRDIEMPRIEARQGHGPK